MKQVLLILFLYTGSVFAQDIKGDWVGVISISGMTLNFGMQITADQNVYHSIMDIPDQKAMGIKMTSTTFENKQVTIESAEMGGVFKGKLEGEEIAGTFTQRGASMPFCMKRGKLEAKVINRPQEPKAPFNYEIEEVTFVNEKENITLSGTLTIPKGKGPFPAVVLVSGSGQQNRDSEILNHKPFFVIADYLTNNGIAVLRYDDRGVGKSTGDPTNSTSADFALDAQAAVQFLRNNRYINKKKIGIIGHSEGGIIAPMVAANKKNKVGFVVLLGGPALKGTKVLLEQQTLISRATGESEEEIAKNRRMSEAIFQFLEEKNTDNNLEEALFSFTKKYLQENNLELPENVSLDQMAQLLAKTYSASWVKFFLLHDPKENIVKLKCPVLALNGEKDIQVIAEPNIEKFKEFAKESGNKSFETKIFPDLNHLFQHCDTGAPNEYAQIEETFSPEVLEFIKNWIIEMK
jgi:hypothetical protein